MNAIILKAEYIDTLNLQNYKTDIANCMNKYKTVIESMDYLKKKKPVNFKHQFLKWSSFHTESWTKNNYIRSGWVDKNIVYLSGKFKHTKGVIKNRKSRKNKQYNGRKKTYTIIHTMVNKTLHRKLKIAQHKPIKTRVNSGVPKC